MLSTFQYIGTISLGPKCKDARPAIYQKLINKLLWFVGTARNAIVVIACGLISYAFYLSGSQPFQVIGKVPPGLPSVGVPPFGFARDKNGTEVSYSFFEMVGDLESGIIVVPLLGLLETIAICKAFCKYFFFAFLNMLCILFCSEWEASRRDSRALCSGFLQFRELLRPRLPGCWSPGSKCREQRQRRTYHLGGPLHWYHCYSVPPLLHTLLLLHPQGLPRGHHHSSRHLHGGVQGDQADVEIEK